MKAGGSRRSHQELSPVSQKEERMKKLVVSGAIAAAALLAAMPSPALAQRVGGIGGVRIGGFGGGGFRIGGFGGSGARIGGLRPIAIGRTPNFSGRGFAVGPFYGQSGWYSSPVLYRPWLRSYHDSYTVGYGYPSTGIYYSGAYPVIQTTPVHAATIEMSVPSSARVWLEGEATAQAGANRVFVSPALEPGYDYVYHVRVQWDENGRSVERRRDITVRAGDQIQVHFES
jgi:uncharacterized protein (TIGR03000 family)